MDGYIPVILFTTPFVIAALLGALLAWGNGRVLAIAVGIIGGSLMAMASIGMLSSSFLTPGAILLGAAVVTRSLRA